MSSETAREAWMKLKEEYERDLKAIRVQIFNLKREFEMLRMRDEDTVRDFTDYVMEIVNKIRLLGDDLTDERGRRRFWLVYQKDLHIKLPHWKIQKISQK